MELSARAFRAASPHPVAARSAAMAATLPTTRRLIPLLARAHLRAF
jgi:hypothetical protein